MAVAMSGGVDSSVAAALLVRGKASVIGVTFRLFGCELGAAGEGSCCSRADVADAMRVANALGIPHVVTDFSPLFKRHVIDPFVAAYRDGLTPNPCVLCNQHIKFRALLDLAQANGATHIATGHYARVEESGARFRLLCGRDRGKDQSYFLFPVGQATLSRTLFPVGDMEKPAVRAVASELGLPVAAKKESQEICFATGGSYVRFLEMFGNVRRGSGDVVLEDGTVVGRHEGLHRHTVGQRKGLGIGYGSPLYVVAKDVEGNRLVVGPREALRVQRIDAGGPVWTSGIVPVAGARVEAAIRYRSKPVPATVTAAGPDGFSFTFDHPVEGVAPGQAAVLYDRDEVLGGGFIRSARRA